MKARVAAVAFSCLMAALPITATPAGAAPSPTPFGSWSAMVDRLYLDVTARPPTPAERTQAASALAAGTQTPGGLVAELRRSPDNLRSVDPVTRLYRAFLLRTPDRGGLVFWLGRHRSGSWQLVRIADHFAASSEFARRYGALSNRAFVELIYANVLERTSDPTGLAYWTRQLDQRRRSRGAVMANFSESSEFRRKQSAHVDVAVLTIFLLGRSPTPQEVTAGVAALTGGSSTAGLAGTILASSEYAARIPGPLLVIAGAVPAGAVGQPYGTTLVAARGAPPYTWSATGLPPGLGIDPDGSIAGSPVVAGTSSVEARVTDSAGTTATTVLSIAVAPPNSPTDPLAGATAIAVGDHHSCAIVGGGAVVCWGSNQHRQLGDGTTIDRTTPVVVPGITAAIDISAGESHTCAVLADGTIRCWGSNGAGKLGDGTGHARTTPVAVTGITTATAVAAGGSHTCAILIDATTMCWGSRMMGQLGDNTYFYYSPSRPTPGPVIGTSQPTSISSGSLHSCVVDDRGIIRCWGANYAGQVGDGTDTYAHLTPVNVLGVMGATDVAAGFEHTCARFGDHTLRCWGNNDAGQLGDGTTITRTAPVAVPGATTATGITAGGAHTCAPLAGGSIACWGSNEHGQLGDGSGSDRTTPVAVPGIATATVVAAGLEHTCALLADRTVRCWGNNDAGQLGDGTMTGSPTPITVAVGPG